MNTFTGNAGVVAIADRPWTVHAIAAAHAAAARRKGRATAAPTIASVDRSLI